MPFGQWVRDTREAKDMKQKTLAETLGMRQQEISKLELQGIMPKSPQAIERICQALGQNIADAMRHILQGSTTDTRVQRYQIEVLEFKEHMRELAEKEHRVAVFFFTEDPHPVDEVAIEWHREMLLLSPDLSYTFLFRFPRNDCANSFKFLVREVARSLPESGGKDVYMRLRAFCRRPEHAEDLNKAIPFGAHPMLVVTPKTTELHMHNWDQSVVSDEMQSGAGDALARHRATCIYRTNPENAQQYLQYTGWESVGEPDREFWMPVTLSEAQQP